MSFSILGAIAEFEISLLFERARMDSKQPGPAAAPTGRNPSSARAGPTLPG